MSTGKDIISITQKTISIDDAYKQVVLPSTGATSLFVGTTRDTFKEKKVLKLEYEAYEPMAIKELKKICAKVRENLSVENICIVHRIGEVAIADASVIIAVSSVHRKESLEAVQYIIDELKNTAPIWKKEVYEQHEAEWKSNELKEGEPIWKREVPDEGHIDWKSDELKADVPIWQKEISDQDQTQLKSNELKETVPIWQKETQDVGGAESEPNEIKTYEPIWK
eukprot:gene11127-12298_t